MIDGDVCVEEFQCEDNKVNILHVELCSQDIDKSKIGIDGVKERDKVVIGCQRFKDLSLHEEKQNTEHGDDHVCCEGLVDKAKDTREQCLIKRVEIGIITLREPQYRGQNDRGMGDCIVVTLENVSAEVVETLKRVCRIQIRVFGPVFLNALLYLLNGRSGSHLDVVI